MGFQIVQAFHAKRQNQIKHLLNDSHIGFYTSVYLIIRVPDSRILHLLARSMLLTLLIVSFSWLSSFGFGVDSVLPKTVSVHSDSDTVSLELLPVLFHDLKNEGLLKLGDKALFVSGRDDVTIQSSQIISENEMLMVSVTDEERQSSIPNETFDFAFAHSFHVSAEFIDRTLKVGGVVTIQLNESPTFSFKKPPNYQIIYLRQFESKILAMKKTKYVERRNAIANRKLLDYTEEAKKKALNKLEDVLLEPPRAASRKSRTYQKRTRYLPDLMGDSLDLESYPRRVFIDVGLPEREGGSGTNWFANNYPTRNLEFEIYKIETVTEELTGKEVVPQMGMSDWLRENVKEEEYVVMKAEAEVVEEMLKSKASKLVDELFLECKPKGLGLGGRKSYRSKSGRAYWECLALYGKLRDEGVAVHQWWG